MYNKIASIILNSGKAAGLNDVYVAQPDTLKENLAGKVFVLAEISGKKSEAKKIFDFLIAALQDSYYNDEKIMLRGKIEGLKIENIFEAALSKINKALADFLLAEKIRLNTASTSLTIGVIYENKLHFANFGRNRALLLYRHGEHYEIINVEVNATEEEAPISRDDPAVPKAANLFSSVISGEIPSDSYFIFTSEAMPEYLSGKDMVNIVTKLPPITAAEQIKNVLSQINAYVPFLGIIIKNTMGLAGAEVKEEPEESLTAHSSISSLNYTEQKTEEMLSPAGLINFSHIFKRLHKAIKGLQSAKPVKRSFKPEFSPEEKSVVQPVLNLGTVKSLNTARPDSFFIKEKIFFKKNPGRLVNWLKKAGSRLGNIFHFRVVGRLSAKAKAWLQTLNQKKRLLFIVLGAVSCIFVISVIVGVTSHRRKIARENFDSLIAQIEEQKNLIDSHLLYNDDEGAKSALIEAQAIASSLPHKNKDDLAAYDKLQAELRAQEEKVQKISHPEAVKVNDLSGLEIKSLAFTGNETFGILQGASDKFIYGLKPDSASSTKTEMAAAASLSKPQFDSKNSFLYYWDNAKQVIQFNPKTKSAVAIKLPEIAASADIVSFKVYKSGPNNNLYTIDKAQSRIYRQTRGQDGFGATSDWLKEPADLSQASDLYVDGDIYVLKQNGEVLKFYLGKAADFTAAIPSPVMTGANKLIVGAKYIYIFEPGSKRLAVLAKEDGHLMAQYIADSLNQPQDFAVDESGRVAYFLDGEAIYKITLNQ